MKNLSDGNSVGSYASFTLGKTDFTKGDKI